MKGSEKKTLDIDLCRTARVMKGIWLEHKRKGKAGDYKLRKASTVRGGAGIWGELRNLKPIASVLGSISILPDIFMLFVSPFFSGLLWFFIVLSSLQGAGYSVLLGTACVCVSQSSHSLQKWPNPSFSLFIVSRISIPLNILPLKIDTACI